MKDVNYYLNLPYTVTLRRDEDGDTVARVVELPGCTAHGHNKAEALKNLDENMSIWITDCLESGDPIPEPVGDEDLPSGKWVQRVPRTLHRKLIQAAQAEKSSLNQLVTSILAEALGGRGRPVVTDVSAGQMMASDVTWACSPGQNYGIYPMIHKVYGGIAAARSPSVRFVTWESPSWNIEQNNVVEGEFGFNVPLVADALLGSGSQQNYSVKEPFDYGFEKETRKYATRLRK